MKKKIVSILIASAMAVSMIGCGSTDTGTEETGAADAETSVVDGGATADATAADTSAAGASASSEDLNVMIETPVESLDPQQATDGTSFEVIADYTDGLMQMDADGKSVNALAESVDTSEDGLTYTFHLKDA